MEDSKVNDMLCINTVRCLAADVVQGANSGHPGMPMGMAPITHVLFKKYFNCNPSNPTWFNRDRWVLSNGHGCALQYIFLHLNGYEKVTMDELRKFRQLDSKTPGHPENFITPGVEVTTGPLGQGVGNAVGLAMARVHLAAVYNKPDFPIFDNWTYVYAGDGCMQEGVTSEAASLAGHLQIPHLICVYDDNHVSIDGDTELSFSEDVPKRFEAYGWHTIVVKNGDADLEAMDAALAEAKKVGERKPVFISLRTTIGFGASKQGTEAVHGSALGADDIKKVKAKFGFDPAKSYVVPDEVYKAYPMRHEGPKLEEQWNALFKQYKSKYPKEGAEIERRYHRKLPDGWKDKLPKFGSDAKPNATRNLSEQVLQAFAPVVPEFIGGSADLNPSTKTYLKCSKDFEKAHYAERNIRYGIREHGMAAVNNGLYAYGGIIPYASTFFNFIEYCFPAVRLSAISHIQQVFIMTHDSIGLGEDGPTHQPIEAATLCRATPNILVIRPAEGNETVGAYVAALENHHGPTVIILTRQNVPPIATATAAGVAKGGYVVHETDAKVPDLIYVATGSEVGLAIDSAKKLDKLKVRVVSMPSTTLFDQQPVEYRRSILTPGVPVISIEALSVTGWERYAHFSIGMTTFGASAPDKDLFNKFGFTPEKVVAKTNAFLEHHKKESKELGLSPTYPLAVHFTSAL